MLHLIVGLGNKGNCYHNSRHNIGFLFLDFIAQAWDTKNRERSKFQAKIVETVVAEQEVSLVYPMTYMNNSGIAVSMIKNFYKIPIDNIIVVHDDLDLSLGRIKCKIGGGHGGHNGLKSLNQHIGKDYTRIRIGIGRNNKLEASNYVLSDFTKQEISYIHESFVKIKDNIGYLLVNNINKFLNGVANHNTGV